MAVAMAMAMATTEYPLLPFENSTTISDATDNADNIMPTCENTGPIFKIGTILKVKGDNQQMRGLIDSIQFNTIQFNSMQKYKKDQQREHLQHHRV